MNKKYYEAYDMRYRAVHSAGLRWTDDIKTPAVPEMINKYCKKGGRILEIGCGEGRDAKALLCEGYDLYAADISGEAIAFCRSELPGFADRFLLLDCINGSLDMSFDFIYSVAVLHMLTGDDDRAAFYAFIKNHLYDNGKALVLSMGDGVTERTSDPDRAFEQSRRNCRGTEVTVAATTCRTVGFETFEREIKGAGFVIAEKGITSCEPEFDSLMYAVIY